VNGDTHQQALAKALSEAQQAAQQGYDLANEALSLSLLKIDTAIDELATAEERLRARDKAGYALALVTHHRKLLQDRVRTSIMAEQDTLRHQHLGATRFTITLFGRTMAGKSTLMEALRGGDGSSIGKGTQRTTLDVREYYWGNLRIVDVPGVAAFEGEPDEEVAHKAAERADLILFLITDDAPQATEALHLAKLKQLGKPILGIINVKSALPERVLDDEGELSTRLEQLEERFEENRLKTIAAQFLAFTRTHGIETKIDFIPAHLRAHYLAGRTKDAAVRRRLLGSSRFEALESRISAIILERGAFLRLRTLADRALPPMGKACGALWELSRAMRRRTGEATAVAASVDQWMTKFREQADQRILSEASSAIGALRSKVELFVDRHVEDANIERAWQEHVHQAKLTEVAVDLQRALTLECSQQLDGATKFVVRDLEINELLSTGEHVEKATIYDYKRVWGWASALASGGLAIAGLFTAGATLPASLAVGGSGLLTGFLESRHSKLSRAKRELAQQLERQLDEIEQQFETHLRLWLRKTLLDGALTPAVQGLTELGRALEEVATILHSMAGELAAACKGTLVLPLVKRALVTIDARTATGALSLPGRMGASAFEPYVQDAARIPTEVALLCREGFQLPGVLRLELERLFESPVHVLVDTGRPTTNATRLLAHLCRREPVVEDAESDGLLARPVDQERSADTLLLASLLVERPVFAFDPAANARRWMPPTPPAKKASNPLSTERRRQMSDLLGVSSPSNAKKNGDHQ